MYVVLINSIYFLSKIIYLCHNINSFTSIGYFCRRKNVYLCHQPEQVRSIRRYTPATADSLLLPMSRARTVPLSAACGPCPHRRLCRPPQVISSRAAAGCWWNCCLGCWGCRNACGWERRLPRPGHRKRWMSVGGGLLDRLDACHLLLPTVLCLEFQIHGINHKVNIHHKNNFSHLKVTIYTIYNEIIQHLSNIIK